MKALSSTLVTGLADTDGATDIFTTLGPILSCMRGRPVVLKRTLFPPDTTSGLWLDLPDMDIVAVRQDTADSEHEHVILGHEIWHMFHGQCKGQSSAGRAAARSQSEPTEVIREIVAQLVSSSNVLCDKEPADLQYAARTDFNVAEEIEAEMFGLHFGTELRSLSKDRRHPDRRHVAGRIEESLGRGPWN
ncbi:toxin-antitoxin system, toxin component (plasmid) [Streptomyces sp. NBC_01558]|uniref:toxin-antitoxin system, toxin component n=1 Tax=Streptomyces sp. NBC_01558 TaxID=2975878 RepID=UPI002DD9ECF3|nr:toxin-antitoxin system, toxin component [Streptomyces sp. NBC_01558]WSD82703.1 toxin-antitoxin system, toxin component [Streptomyces sp. NBC_01558]